MCDGQETITGCVCGRQAVPYPGIRNVAVPPHLHIVNYVAERRPLLHRPLAYYCGCEKRLFLLLCDCSLIWCAARLVHHHHQEDDTSYHPPIVNTAFNTHTIQQQIQFISTTFHAISSTLLVS